MQLSRASLRHGKNLREEKREFIRERDAMSQEEAEADRESILRAELLREAGLESRHKREYAVPGQGDTIGGFRYTELEKKEAGLDRRLKSGQDYARPGQTAEIGKLGAETSKIRQDTEFEKSLEGTLRNIIGSRASMTKSEAEEAGLGISEERYRIARRAEAEKMAEANQIKLAAEANAVEAAKPGKRKMRPGLKKFLWEGYDTPIGFMPGIGTPVKGYMDLSRFLTGAAKKGYDYAFPRGE